MAESSPVSHAWDRWWRFWHVLFFACLIFATALAFHNAYAVEFRPLMVATVVAFAGWYVAWVLIHPQWMERTGFLVVYLVGMHAFAGTLVYLDPYYFVLLYALYPQVFSLVPTPWTYGVVVVLGAVVFGVGGYRYGVGVVEFTASVGLALVIGLFINAIASQSLNRHEAIQELTEANERLAAALAENERLQEQVRTAGALAERQRLAREIHDTIAQGLIAIVTQLEAAEREDPDERGRRIVTARRLARENLDEARRAVDALRPAALEKARLPAALAEVAEGWSAAHGVTTTVTSTGTPTPLHPEIEVTLLRVTQEALSNVARHAAASRIWVTLSYMEDLVTVDVRDDGKGFDPARPSSPGYGLTAMRERVGALGGELAVESTPGAGTVISAGVPVREAS